MRTGKPGKWWVLQRGPGLYWTGELVETPVGGEMQAIPVYSVERGLAQQFTDRAAAVFMVSMFDLTFAEPAELEFAS